MTIQTTFCHVCIVHVGITVTMRTWFIGQPQGALITTPREAEAEAETHHVQMLMRFLFELDLMTWQKFMSWRTPEGVFELLRTHWRWQLPAVVSALIYSLNDWTMLLFYAGSSISNVRHWNSLTIVFFPWKYLAHPITCFTLSLKEILCVFIMTNYWLSEKTLTGKQWIFSSSVVLALQPGLLHYAIDCLISVCVSVA